MGRYRPELDGLRAIAILLTLAAHLHIPLMEGGGVAGVTLFFVLSGFLITTLLRRELAETGTVSLRAFYARRIRRLLPALVALLVVVGFVQVVIFDRAGEFVGDAAVVLAYGASIASSLGRPLTFLNGTWSLSIEEMFYLVWPVLFLAVRGHRALLGVLAVGIVASIVSRVLATPGPLVYNRADIRADAIMWGCVLGFAAAPRLPRWAPLVGWLAFVFVLLEVSLPIDLTLAALGSVVLVASARPGWLSWRPLVRIGQVSYAAYLWQMLVIGLVAPQLGVIDPVRWILASAAVFALAFASERWVERPFRHAPTQTDQGRVMRTQSHIVRHA